MRQQFMISQNCVNNELKIREYAIIDKSLLSNILFLTRFYLRCMKRSS
jgi:hypothetical protein